MRNIVQPEVWGWNLYFQGTLEVENPHMGISGNTDNRIQVYITSDIA